MSASLTTKMNTERFIYEINGKTINCPKYIKKTDSNGHIRDLSSNEKLCDLLDTTRSLADYNLSRMKKLNDEYKCSPVYITYLNSEKERAIPDCKSLRDSGFKAKFDNAFEAVADVSRTLVGEGNSYVKTSIKEAKDTLQALKDFTSQNIDKVNLAFEKALYDTNGAGVANVLLSLFSPLGIIAAMGNTLYNNEFDGKISRAYDEVINIEEKLDTITSMISHTHHDIYVD